MADARDSKSRGSNTVSVRVRPPAPKRRVSMESDCVFCKIISRKLPAEVIAEDDDILVIKDIAPKAPIHYLIMPKQHYKDLQDLDNCCVGAGMLMMAKRVAETYPEAKDFKLVMNNGYNAGQRVFHLHMHFLAGPDLPGIV